MSDPSNNLRKVRKTPLPGHPKVPFRHIVSDEESPWAGSSGLSPLDDSIHKAIIDDLKSHTVTREPAVKASEAATDAELLVSMTQRLGMVEKELLESKRMLIERDEYINKLERKIAAMKASLDEKSEGSVAQTKWLEKQCQALQKQVDEMEEFLNDYGMVWVGGEKGNYNSNGDFTGDFTGGFWSPTKSTVEISVDYDAIVRNVTKLNILAGEGSTEVTKTAQGAQLKVLEPVPLTLFKNGLALFSGPFRPYSDPSTQDFVRDLIDGYFPSELQSQYPDGFPIALNDQRDVMFQNSANKFPGSGYQLGGDKGPSRLVPAGELLRSPLTAPHSELKTTSELPGGKISLDQFLSKLPPSVMRQGRVLEIRSGIKDILQGNKGRPQLEVTLVKTPVLEEMEHRLDLVQDERPHTPSCLTTLRIKECEGEQTYILKMKQNDTIGDVRKCIDKTRKCNPSAHDYVLKTTFPPSTLDDESASLLQCGLTPTATLYMAKSHGS